MRILTCIALMFSVGLAAAELTPKLTPELTKAQLKKKLTANLPNLNIVEIRKMKELNMFLVVTDDFEELYVTPDGRHFIAGEQYEFDAKGKPRNLSRINRQKKQFALVRDIPGNKTIIFPAKGKTKAWVLVFTDIDCGYCRKLHREINEITKLGIEVRYAAFPRTGPGTGSFKKAINVWCSANKQQAMTLAKQGKKITAAPCDHPVTEQYNLGKRAGVRGTPTMFLSNGKVVPGYIPSIKLAETLRI